LPLFFHFYGPKISALGVPLLPGFFRIIENL